MKYLATVVLLFSYANYFSFGYLASRSFNCKYRINVGNHFLSLEDGNSYLLPAIGASTAAIIGIKLGTYWRMQYATASIIGGIPKNSKVIEIDAVDGKNVFYLSQGCEYTAVMPSIEADDKKSNDKFKLNEQLILESVGRANRAGTNLSAKVRRRTQDIMSKSADCVISIGSLSRSSSPAQVALEAYRVLRPGGVFLFVEPDGRNTIIDIIKQAFPETLPDKAAAVEKSQKGKPKKSNDLMAIRKAAKTKRRSDINEKEEITASQENEVMTPQDTIPVGVSFIDSPNLTDEKDPSNNATEVDTDTDTENDEGSSRSRSDEVPIITDRRGIAFERIQNIFDPYVTGLVVRP